MAQTFQAIKCYQCQTFQVQIKKKSNRWACKLCGEKQSLIKIYGEGSSKDCRIHVQKLNALRATQDEAKRSKLEATNEMERVSTASSLECMEDDITGHVAGTSRTESKWTAYLKNDSGNDAVSDTEEETDVPEIPHSKKNTIPNSKWAVYVENDSPSTGHGMVDHETDQMNLTRPRRQEKGQMSSGWNGRRDVRKHEAEFSEKDSTPHQKSDSYNETATPRHKRRSSEHANCSTPKKLYEEEKVKSSAINTQNTPPRIAGQECAKVFSLTGGDELDDILKM